MYLVLVCFLTFILTYVRYKNIQKTYKLTKFQGKMNNLFVVKSGRKVRFLLLKLSVILVICQSVSGQEIMGVLNDFYTGFLNAKANDPEYFSRISGSPYENPEFSDALVYMNGNRVPLRARMRYNNCFNEMEYVRNEDDQILVLDNKEFIDSIRFEAKTYQYLGYTKDKIRNAGYFELVFKGKCSLYMVNPREFQEEKVPESGYEEYAPPRFVTKPEEFYIRFGNDPLVSLPHSKKKITALFSEKGFDTGGSSKLKYNRESLYSFVQSCCGSD